MIIFFQIHYGKKEKLVHHTINRLLNGIKAQPKKGNSTIGNQKIRHVLLSLLTSYYWCFKPSEMEIISEWWSINESSISLEEDKIL
jgi:hypothetical protein